MRWSTTVWSIWRKTALLLSLFSVGLDLKPWRSRGSFQ
jgi:hypothetical protein